MAHETLRLAQSLYNKPHLVTGDFLDSVIEYLGDRNTGNVELSARETLAGRSRDLNYNPDTQIGWVSMEGPLTYLQYEGLCGPSGPSYQKIRDEVKQMLDSGAKLIVLDQDSPGGEAYQAFETAEYIRQEADKHGAKIIAYVDGMSASASYVFSAVADEVIMNPQAEVGSIGVVVKLRNINGAMRNAGVEDTYVYAGESKVPFDEDGKFTPDFINDLQEKVDSLYVDFVQHVSTMRGISPESVVATQAKTFMADQAITLGLADKKMTLSEFAEYLADISQSGGTMPIGNIFKTNKQEDDLEMTALAQAQEQIASLEASLVEAQAAVVELAQVKEQLTQMKEAAATTEAALKEAQAQLEAVAQEKEQMKAEARKEKLAAVMSDEQVENVFQALAGLDDTAFEAVLQSYSLAAKAVEDGMMFQEVGGQGAVETQADATQEDTTTKLLKQRFAN